MYYDLNANWKLCPSDEPPSSHYAAVLTKEEALEDKNISELLKNMTKLYKEVPFTKVEIYENFIYGTISIPPILNHEKAQFSFILTEVNLYLISSSDFFMRLVEQLLELRRTHMCDNVFSLYHLMEYLIEKDLEKINLIQDQLSRLEEQIFHMTENNYSGRLTEFRSKTLQLSHYYLQLTALITILTENSNGFFNNRHLQRFELLANRITLLKEESAQLWSYTSQVREIYQEQLDVRQNQIMRILTIVTTLFFPLSIITGWYGMNFEYMPELHHRYGYLIVIIVSILIVTLCCIWFKKKKFW